MKAQMTVEYVITFVAFIGFMIFIYVQYSSNIPDFIIETKKENSRSKAYQLSELLLNDAGQPSNWNLVSVQRIGLLDQNYNKSNLLSLEKITNLNSMCPNDYQDVQTLLALDQSFSIHFYNITDTGVREILLDCSPSIDLLDKTELNTTIKRITSFVDNSGNKNFGELIIEV